MPRDVNISHALTKRGVFTHLFVVAGEALLCSPAIVSTLDDKVHLLELVLSHVPTEQAAMPLPCNGITPVNGAAPHIPYPVGVNLRPGPLLSQEGVVRGDAVGGTIIIVVHINTKHFTQ